MSNQTRFSQGEGDVFEMVRKENGQTVVYRTDKAWDFIRQNLEDHINDYGLADQVVPNVEDAGAGWTRVEVSFDPKLQPRTVDLTHRSTGQPQGRSPAFHRRRPITRTQFVTLRR